MEQNQVNKFLETVTRRKTGHLIERYRFPWIVEENEAFKIVSTLWKTKEAAVEAIRNIIEKSQSKVSSFNIE